MRINRIKSPVKVVRSRNFSYSTDKLLRNVDQIYDEYQNQINRWRPIEEINEIWNSVHSDPEKIKQIYKDVRNLYDSGVTSVKEISKILGYPPDVINPLVKEYEFIADELDQHARI